MPVFSHRCPSLSPLLALAGLGLLMAAPAHANDRPYQYARTAVMEDDEQVWSFESWAQRYGSVRGLSFEPEYSFTTSTSLQMELTRLVDRHDEETGHEVELEFKHLFNNIARDGWGWGISAALAAERSSEDGHTVNTLGLKLPFSWAMPDGEGFVHANVGLDKATDTRRIWTTSFGIERDVGWHTTLFAEYAHEGTLKFAQIGGRHWLKKEKLAVDLSLQQSRVDGNRAPGFIVGVGWYDL